MPEICSILVELQSIFIATNTWKRMHTIYIHISKYTGISYSQLLTVSIQIPNEQHVFVNTNLAIQEYRTYLS